MPTSIHSPLWSWFISDVLDHADGRLMSPCGVCFVVRLCLKRTYPRCRQSRSHDLMWRLAWVVSIVQGRLLLVRPALVSSCHRCHTRGAHAGCFPGMWFHSTKFLRDSELTLAYAVILSSAVISQVSPHIRCLAQLRHHHVPRKPEWRRTGRTASQYCSRSSSVGQDQRSCAAKNLQSVQVYLWLHGRWSEPRSLQRCCSWREWGGSMAGSGCSSLRAPPPACGASCWR